MAGQSRTFDHQAAWASGLRQSTTISCRTLPIPTPFAVGRAGNGAPGAEWHVMTAKRCVLACSGGLRHFGSDNDVRSMNGERSPASWTDRSWAAFITQAGVAGGACRLLPSYVSWRTGQLIQEVRSWHEEQRAGNSSGEVEDTIVVAG